MSGLGEISVRVDEQDQYARKFEVWAGELDDMREPLLETAHTIEAAVSAQFLSLGNESGAPWPPLSARYKVWKDRNYPGRPLLVRTGQMRGELTTDQGIKSLEQQRLVFGTDLDYAYYHQHGSGHNPTRRIVDLNTAWRRQVDRIFAEWLNHKRTRIMGAGA